MSNYQNGKIYKITGTNNQGKELIYIGSTVQQLNKRLTQHKSRSYSSKIILETCNNYQIILIENYPCNTKKELFLRERYFYEIYDCVNIKTPIYLNGELQQIKAIYNLNHKEEKSKYNEQYRLDNIDKEKERQKLYRLKKKNGINNYSLNFFMC